MIDKKDYTGKRFGRLYVVRKVPRAKAQWECICDCGNRRTLMLSKLKELKSCGCLEAENRKSFGSRTNLTHGKTNTVLYSKYCSMKGRCNNPNYYRYDRYGGRGIRICDEWLGKHGFENFYKWAYENGYDDNKTGYEQTLDRINVNGNYEPSNCRWITQKEQSRNTSHNVYVLYKGEKVVLSVFCEMNNITYHAFVTRRLKRGLSAEKIIDDWNKTHNVDGVMGVKEATEYYKVCDKTIRSWIKQGKLEVIHTSGKIIIPKGQIVERRTDRDIKGRFLKGITNR